jgi:uncharacterized 2Fe-2S/4Fe-4S cluster protein (DUF4445 family)
LSRILRLPAGAPLSDRLFAAGVEFPCGGEGICGGCRFRFPGGDWELACQTTTTAAVTVEVEQWTAPPTVLTDEAALTSIEPQDGLGYAIDLGSTTLVAQRVDLRTGEIVKIRTGINPQTRRGADIMSRIAYDLEHPGELTAAIRKQLGALLGRRAKTAIIAGNTAMHHLFCGLSVEPLAGVPFRSPHLAARRFRGDELDWPVDEVIVLPCIGGFVGGDTVAGLAVTPLGEGDALVDLGTNSEVCVARGGRMLCASTAAGPAFESAKYRRGTHLVETVAAALAAGHVLPSGRLAPGAPADLTQAHVRQLQLAKAAVASGLALLEATGTLHIAGAFGNYVRESDARRIGLLPASAPIQSAGNAALRGARFLLLNPSRRDEILADLLARTEHVELAALPEFQDAYVGAMPFA